MTARLLDGRGLAADIRAELTRRVDRLRDAGHHGAPQLAIVRAGSAEAADAYAASLARAARSVGAERRMVGPSPAEPLEETIRQLNADPQVAGIVLAQPATDGARLVEVIDPSKDVDGATPTNAGRLARGQPAFVPATASAVLAILDGHGVEVAGRLAVVVGRSAVVGRPVASLLLARDATVVVCHRGTRRLAEETRRAEVLVVAAGVPGLVGADMVADGAVVVDCGINVVAGGAMVGDVDQAAVARVAGAISPVPGGVGPVTPMMVLRQTIESAERIAADRAV